MGVAKITQEAGEMAVRAALKGNQSDLATATRYLLQLAKSKYPGGAVEVRVPPFGAAQIIAGPEHTRGTPSNVVELSPENWLLLATGKKSFEELHASGLLLASGNRSDLAHIFPIFIA